VITGHVVVAPLSCGRADVCAQTRSNVDVSRWSTDHQPMVRSRRSLGGRNPRPTRRWNDQIRFERPFAYLFGALGVLAAIVGLVSWVSSAPTPHTVGGVVLALVAAALAPFAFSRGVGAGTTRNSRGSPRHLVGRIAGRARNSGFVDDHECSDADRDVVLSASCGWPLRGPWQWASCSCSS
jgi:hypothetical protein